MKVFMYEKSIVNLEAIEYVTTGYPDNYRKTQVIRFHLRNGNDTSITVPISEVQKILKIIYEEMIGE